jgi:hypothetical protein
VYVILLPIDVKGENMKLKLPERRRFVRVETPLKVVVTEGDRVDEVVTKNISPMGFRFEVGREYKNTECLDLSLYIPSTEKAIHIKGKVVWQDKISLEDNAPYDVGIEVTQVDEKDKNAFLKYLCDLLYKSSYKART